MTSMYCTGSHCVSPPSPDSKHKLKLVWNSNYPPAHGQTVTYVCNAGNKWNRFETDFNRNSLTLTCLEDNKFSEVAWPTCVNGKLSHSFFRGFLIYHNTIFPL